MNTNDIPTCCRCGAIKTEDELSGFDLLAAPGEKYKDAYCVQILDCNSKEADETLQELYQLAYGKD